MEIDLNLIPATLDVVHLGLAALALLSLLIAVLLAIITVFALSRRPKKVSSPVSAPPESVAPLRTKQEETSRVERQPPVIIREASPDAALQLLGLLQQEARFVDFVQENITSHSDADIGAAVRVIHEGCRKVLKQHMDIEPVRSEPESSRINLPKGFDASSVRVSGNVVGEPPFTGILIHRGWRVSHIHLPRLTEGHDARVLAPAEVEL